MSAVLCLGEILVDWVCTETGAELEEALSFTKAPGGAPANVAVGLARLGVNTAFVGRVAKDAFGVWLRGVLEVEGIDTASTVVDPQAQTRMAYVVTTASGDRKLAEFSKVLCADSRLEPNDLLESQFEKASVLHFGSISLVSSPAAEATKQAVNLARKNKMLVSYDPNVRLGLWPSAEACRHKLLDTLSWADVIKINLDELEFLTGSRELEAADRLRLEHNVPLLVITLDSAGAYFSAPSGRKRVPGFSIDLVEATGAGDGFVAGVILGLLEFARDSENRRQTLETLPLEVLEKIVCRANAIGALTCTKPGAIPALPTLEELNAFMAAAAVSS